MLRVLVYEAAVITSSRPLVALFHSRSDYRVIRPIDLCFPDHNSGHATWDLQHHIEPSAELGNNPQRLAEQWLDLQQLLDAFWQDWREEYVNALRQIHQFQHKQSRLRSQHAAKVGHVVLINNPPLPRGRWRLGLITRLLESSCDRPRAATVRLANGHILVRPVSLLTPIERNYRSRLYSVQ